MKLIEAPIALSVFLITSCSLLCDQFLCNGSAHLCTLRYNEVTYAATHNAQSHIGSDVANQDLGITEQLNRGIRAMKIPIWFDCGADGKPSPHVCHGVTKELLSKSYLDNISNKAPRFLQSFIRDMLKQLEPINEIVRDACNLAYGKNNEKGIIQFKHCIFDPSRRLLTSFLLEIREFIEKNPGEVITLILEDHTRDLTFIEKNFKKSGLEPYLHSQDKKKEWPTLGQMIKDNKRLVVLLHPEEDFSFTADQHPWLHNIWDFVWDTQWEFRKSAELRDERKDILPNRGEGAYRERNRSPKNKLFMVHHYITDTTGGTKSGAKGINKESFLKNRIDRLIACTGCKPTIIQVDFFEYPNHDIFQIVNQLNGIK